MKEEKTLKKFLSVLLTMAMVMSLFTGTVLAAPAVAFTITAGTASYTYKLDTLATTNDKLDYVINAVSDGAEFRQQTGITVTTADTLVVDTSSLTVPTTDASKAYTLTITNTTTAAVQAVTITVLHTLTINGSATAPKAVVGNNTFTGQLTYKGAAVKNMIVSIQDATPTVLASVRTDDSGNFSLNVNFTTPAAFGFYVGAVKYYNVSFDPVEDLKITVTGNPGSIRAATKPTHTVTFTVAALNASVPGFAGTEPVLVNVTMPNGTVVASTTSASPTFTLNLDDGTVPATQDMIAGTYTVQVMTYINAVAGGVTLIKDATASLPARTATTTFTIVDNTSSLFVNAVTIGGLAGGSTSKIPVANTQVVAFTLTAPTARTFKNVAYTVTGPLKATLSSKNNGALNAGTYTEAVKTVDVVGGGSIVVNGTVTYDNDTTETFSKTLTVAGYVVEYTPADLTAVGTEVELKAVVTTAAGVPVNNATVTWTATDYAGAASTTAFTVYNATTSTYVAIAAGNNTVNGTTTIIQNGVYTLKVKLVEPSKITTTVVSNEAATPGATFAVNTKTVYGAEVYTVKAAASNLVATKTGQVINLEVIDADGLAVVPDYIYIDDASAISGYVSVVYGTTTKVTFSPGTTTGTFNIFLGTTAGKKIVKVPVTIVAPVVSVMVNGMASTTVTAGVLEKVELVFADTTVAAVTATPAKVDGSVYTDAAGTIVLAGAINTSAGKATVYTKLVVFKSSTEGTVDLFANFGGGAVKVATLKVVKPTLTTGVTSLDVGTVVDLNLVLTDANGKGMKGFEVKSTGSDAFAGNAAVKTDVDGKAILTVSPNAPGTLTLQIATLKTTDSDDTANDPTLAASVAMTVAIPVVRDTKGPVFNMDAVYSVTAMPATISFNVVDGSKVTEVWIGYEKALVRPDGSVLFTVSGLPVGVTEFDVLAYDYYGNASEATLVVEYLKPSTIVLTIGSEEATRDGVAMTGMDQAPMIRNGRTFLPVRFVFVNLLGGTIQWDATTQTITSVVKGNTIKMVIGSKMAYVNGNVVTLLEAPFIEPSTSRTLVPMREIMEAIGISLDWNVTNQTVTLTIPQ